jgi:hypothetical protein
MTPKAKGPRHHRIDAEGLSLKQGLNPRLHGSCGPRRIPILSSIAGEIHPVYSGQLE